MSKRILFLTLNTFSATGGIEKLCRYYAKCFDEYAKANGDNFRLLSLHDDSSLRHANRRYHSPQSYSAFGGNKITFLIQAFKELNDSDIVVISHINLIFIASFVRKTHPLKQLILLCHGIEVWQLSNLQKSQLKYFDRLFCASSYTRSKIVQYNVVEEKIVIPINPCIDPYLSNSESLLCVRDEWNLNPASRIIFTLCRLSSKERYKGYEKVITAMPYLPESYIFLIAGSYDKEEYSFVENKIDEANVKGRVVITGYLHENELPDYYRQADLFVMPSDQEGFGMVYNEAMYYGLPVLASGKAGAADALLNGALGSVIQSIEPNNLAQQIVEIVENKNDYLPDFDLLQQHFSYSTFCKKITHELDVISAQ